MRVVRRRVRHGGCTVGAQNRAVDPSNSGGVEKGRKEIHLRHVLREFREEGAVVQASAGSVQRVGGEGKRGREAAQGKGESGGKGRCEEGGAAECFGWADRVQRVPQGVQEEEVPERSQNIARGASHMPRVRRETHLGILFENTHKKAQQGVHRVLRDLQQRVLSEGDAEDAHECPHRRQALHLRDLSQVFR